MSYKLFPYCTALHYILFIIVIVDPRINIDKIAKHTFELNSWDNLFDWDFQSDNMTNK